MQWRLVNAANLAVLSQACTCSSVNSKLSVTDFALCVALDQQSSRVHVVFEPYRPRYHPNIPVLHL